MSHPQTRRWSPDRRPATIRESNTGTLLLVLIVGVILGAALGQMLGGMALGFWAWLGAR